MPITWTCTGCGTSFLLNQDRAGREVRCPECDTTQVVPAIIADETSSVWETHSESGPFHRAFDRDRFLLRQKLIAISEKYIVCDDEQRPILFIERPAHFWRNLVGAVVTAFVFLVTFGAAIFVGAVISDQLRPSWVGFVIMAILMALSVLLAFVMAIKISPKRHISFYADETKAELLLQVLQDKKFQPIIATYTVLTPEGDFLGQMKKNYFYNIWRKKWVVFDADGKKVLIAREDLLLLSLLRRLLGPQLGLLRTNFILVVPQSDNTEKTRGEFNRDFTLLDHYVLDLSRDRPRLVDRRLAIALGVLLDTGENR